MKTLLLDPISFWSSTIVDLIFQHLKGNEVLTASVVSAAWEDYIGSSPTCMGKINLTIVGRKYFLSGQENELKKELKMLSSSVRRYENFTFYAQKPGSLNNEVIDLLNSRRGKWKNIKIWSEKFKDESDFELILGTFAKNAENVDLRNISFVQALETYKTVDDHLFLKLKSLSLCNVKSVGRILNCFKNARQIESLTVENGLDELLDSFPDNFSSLEKLFLIVDKWNDEFFQKFSLFNLKIKEFKVKLQSSVCCTDSQTGLIHFLKTQAGSVEKLVFDVPISINVLQTIFKLPNLKVLHLMASLSHEAVELATNSSIIELKFNFVCNEEFLQSVLDAAPNCKSFVQNP